MTDRFNKVVFFFQIIINTDLSSSYQSTALISREINWINCLISFFFFDLQTAFKRLVNVYFHSSVCWFLINSRQPQPWPDGVTPGDGPPTKTQRNPEERRETRLPGCCPSALESYLTCSRVVPELIWKLTRGDTLSASNQITDGACLLCIRSWTNGSLNESERRERREEEEEGKKKKLVLW